MMTKMLKVLVLGGLITTAPAIYAHLDSDEFMQSYRQSFFALLGGTFGHMAAMAKGEIPWDSAAFQQRANNIAALVTINVTRSFPEDSDKGTTRAKPDIWSNKADFEAKFDDMVAAVGDLQRVAATGDESAMKKQLGDTGGTCKACHDEYKSKDYLY